MIQVIESKEQKVLVATQVLADLPEWFGLLESTAEYIECSKDYPFWVASEADEIQGFIVLKETSLLRERDISICRLKQ